MSLDSIGEYINNQQRPSGFRDKSTEKDYENGEKLWQTGGNSGKTEVAAILRVYIWCIFGNAI